MAQSKPLAVVLTLALAGVADAQTRQLDSHEHGQGALNVAIEGKLVEMELEAPGADIVGFEHPAESVEDRAAVDAATARLQAGETLLVVPAAAGCELERATVELLVAGADDDHGHGDHSADGQSHSEFFAQYRFGCADPDAIAEIRFPYFDAFPNAQALRIQVISRRGTAGYDVERADPVLRLGGGS